MISETEIIKFGDFYENWRQKYEGLETFKLFGDTNFMFWRQKYESMETSMKIGDMNMNV